MPRLLELARHLLGDEGEARAAVQDAFVSTCRTLSSFEAPADVSTSLRRSTVRAALERMHGRPAPATAIERLLPTFTEDGRHSPSPTRWPVATPGPAAS
jgi:DNA-directed RNA polymerase specialized sigma24 family protein